MSGSFASEPTAHITSAGVPSMMRAVLRCASSNDFASSNATSTAAPSGRLPLSAPLSTATGNDPVNAGVTVTTPSAHAALSTK